MPGGIINTGSHPKLLWPGIHAIWGQVYDQYPKEWVYLYDEEDSDKAYEEDVQITGFGLAPKKPEAKGISYDSEVQGPVQRYTHVAYALGYIVSYEEMRDNLYETVSQRRAKANAFSMKETVETVAAAVYNDAFTGNVFTFAGSNQPLCSNAQVNTTGGTYSNALTPAADLSESSLEDMCVQIMGAQTDRGLNIPLVPQSLHVSRQDWFNANRILKSILRTGTANNDINVIVATNAISKGVFLNHYFTSPHAWFIRTNCPNGMTMFWRDRPTFDQDNDFDTKNLKASSYMRFSVGCTDPRGIYGSNGP